MFTYRIVSKAGLDCGTWDAETPAAAVLAMHRDAGYGEDIVRLAPDGTGLVFVDDGETADGESPADDSYRALCGDVDDWTIMLVLAGA